MMETSSAYNRGLIMEYRRIIRGKSEFIKRLQSDNNELHKDVYQLSRDNDELTAKHEALKERTLLLWMQLADTVWAEDIRAKRANRRKWRAR